MDFKTTDKELKDMFEPDCQYAKDCSGKGFKCSSCKHNKTKKKDYYERDTPPYIYPHYPSVPYTTPGWKFNKGDIILCTISSNK